VLGVVGGIVSLIFCKTLLACRRMFLNMPPSTLMFQPAIGGAIIGATLLLVPEVRGVGYEYVDQALNGGLVLRGMLVLCVVKLAATVVSYSSGNAGGIFAPSLFIGAMAGGAVGMLVNRVATFPTGEPGAYALVGMGALFAGIIRAPMTSVFMIFETTQDYQIIVPLMVANLLSYVISRRYQPVPVYEALLRQDNVHLPVPSDPDRQQFRALDFMSPPSEFLAPETTVEAALERMTADGKHTHLVGTPERLEGLITFHDLANARARGEGGKPLTETLDTSFVHVHPDHSLDTVLARFAEADGLLPVVSRTAARRVEGVIRIEDLARLGRRRESRDLDDPGSTTAVADSRTSHGPDTA
jgi:CIC family chloride channel protein